MRFILEEKNNNNNSDGGLKPSVQTPPRWHQVNCAQRAHAFTVTLWQSGFKDSANKGLIQTIKTMKDTHTQRTIYKTLVTLLIRFQLLTLTILINMNNNYIACQCQLIVKT